MKVVLDTNVLVSALLTPHGPAARVLDAVLAGQLSLVFDDRILYEYEEVLRRERFGFAQEDVKALLDFIRSEGLGVVAPPLRIALPDPDDLMFVEVAVAGRADAIVTGNKKHFPEGCCGGIPVMSPAEILSLL
ncbi:MAG: putative toxin-antitoxin system toxin component, PIN family [Thermosediminibacteraceae bacterium]|nr:putative toxin-antitoxin system toxin component, PIN family [Thermosediminibacteraceae bacterium]